MDFGVPVLVILVVALGWYITTQRGSKKPQTSASKSDHEARVVKKPDANDSLRQRNTTSDSTKASQLKADGISEHTNAAEVETKVGTPKVETPKVEQPKEVVDDTDQDDDDEEESDDEDTTQKEYSEVSKSGIMAASVSNVGARDYQEDRALIATSVPKHNAMSAFGLFDGHDGPNASKYCLKNMLKFVTASSHFPSDIKKSLEEGFLALDKEFLDESSSGGSTAVLTIIHEGKIYVGNVGDSRCVASVNNKAVALTEDHKPNLPEETKRILATGSHSVESFKELVKGQRLEVSRVDGKLAVSRAIGDSDFKDDPSAEPQNQAVTAFPEVQTRDLAGVQFLVLACDGLWDVMKNEEVVDFVASRINGASTHQLLLEVAKDLVQKAVFELHSSDNVTVTIVKIQKL